MGSSSAFIQQVTPGLSASFTSTMDKKRLLKKVQRMNAAAEEDRLHHADALQRRIRDVEVEIQTLTETIYRLRHARTSDEFVLAKDRREKLRERLVALRHDADPTSEVERINAAIDEAKAKVGVP